jgi:hypothetical protein
MNIPVRSPATPRTDALVHALHEHAAGIPADTAAVDLLANHHTWLARPEFRRHIYIGRCHATDTPMAYIRWRSALTALTNGQLPCSASEANILRIAAALGANIPLHLRHVLGSLDRRHITLVTDAVTYANGT